MLCRLKNLYSNLKFLSKSRINNLLMQHDQENKFLLQLYLNNYDLWLQKSKDLHKGERCFLLGCGPSINQINLDLLSKDVVMGVNGIALIENLRLDYFVSVSHFFWKSHVEKLKNLECGRRFLPNYLKELESDTPTTWLNTVESHNYRSLSNQKPLSFSYEPHRFIFLGGTVIFVCLQILYFLGFNEVILLGVDHDYGLDKGKVPQGGVNVSSDHLTAHFTKNYYRSGENVHIDISGAERGYKLALNAFENDGRKIFNASPGTKLDVFPLKKFEAFFLES